MKAAESKTTTATQALQAKAEAQQPFFQAQSEQQGAFFGQEAPAAKPFFSPFIQTKLSIGQPGDKYEQEADAMAEQVVQKLSSGKTEAPIQRKCAECAAEEEGIAPKLQLKSIFESNEEPAGGQLQRKCEACTAEKIQPMRIQRMGKEEEPELQAKGEVPGLQASADLESRLNSTKGGGSPLSDETRTAMESSFGTDFSGVRVHTNSGAVQMNQELGAQAFTHGSDVYFNSGKYNPGSTEGNRLLGHELTHVVQQGHSLNRRVQRRRVPANSELSAALPITLSNTSLYAEIGMARVLSRAWGGLTPTQQTAVQSATTSLSLTWTNEESLRYALLGANRDTLLRFEQALRTVAPSVTLGDPLLINSGPRPGTADAANILNLVTRANTIFTDIASGARDTDIGQVFGVSNVTTAKNKYNNASIRMNHLHSVNKIVTDRSGYNAEVGLGGLTNRNQISVSPNVMDNPANNESVVTLIHESMHAGNPGDVRDKGYINQPSFTVLSESIKLTNAAHFEVVPRRILGANFAFAGQTFIPAGTAGSPTLTPRQEAIRGASEMFRQAWTIGLNLHNLFVRLFRNPTEWDALNLSTVFSGVDASARFSNTLPFWSKVEKLTTHSRMTEINTSGAAAVRPISIIDIALSEGLVRKLSLGMRNIPQTEAAAQTFETTHATPTEITAAAAGVNAERDLIIKLVIRAHLGNITGSLDRDEAVVRLLGQTNNLIDVLTIRPLSAFPF